MTTNKLYKGHRLYLQRVSTSIKKLSSLEIASAFIAFTIPFPVIYNNISIGLFIATWLIYVYQKRIDFYSLINKWELTLLMLAFLLTTVRMFDSDNLEMWIHSVERSASLLVFPLILGTATSVNSRKLFKVANNSFVVAILFLALVFVANFLLQFNNLDPTDRLPIEAIAPYSSNYFSFHIAYAVIVLVNMNIERRMPRIAFIFCFALLSMVLILVANKMAAIALLLTIFYMLSSKFGFRKAVLYLIALSILTSILILSIPTSKSRFDSIINREYTFRKNDYKAQNSITMRIEKWKCATQLFKENFWFGLGVNIQKELNNCYKTNEFWGWVKSYNTHNQYLDFGVRFGIIGFLLVVSIILLPMTRNTSGRTLLFYSFLILFGLIFLTENIFARQKGIVMFSFFYSLSSASIYTTEQS